MQMDVAILRFSSSLPNVGQCLLTVHPYMKYNKIQRIIASFGVLMDLGDEMVFLVYCYYIPYKGLNNCQLYCK